MNVIICPGIHDSALTDSFIASLSLEHNLLVFPTNQYPAYASWHIIHWLQQQTLVSQKLLFITFSAGVVGGMGAAIALQLLGYKIAAFIAIDGWGVPLFPLFPLYRLSHDYFTHWSSAILGSGNESFYAEPAISHLEIWRSPETCLGWRVLRKNSETGSPKGFPKGLASASAGESQGDREMRETRLRCSAKNYIKFLLDKYSH